jgi:hypothetical protein
MFYYCDIPQKLYRELNQSGAVKKYFDVRYVGKCIDLIEQYYASTDATTHKGWESFYEAVQGWNGLKNAAVEISKLFPNADVQDIKRYVYHRVIGQTWNGLNRELILVQDLSHWFPELNIHRASFEIDHQYCIDVEVRLGEQVLLGIQLKPESYQRMSAPSQMQSKQAHYIKNEQYAKDYAPYLYVYYNGTTGEILNIEQVFDYIKSLMNNANTEAAKW